MASVLYTFGFLLLVLTSKPDFMIFLWILSTIVSVTSAWLCAYGTSLVFSKKLHSLNSNFTSTMTWFDFVHTGKVESVTFEQSSSQIVKEGTPLRINCSYDDSSLDTMLWYQYKQTSRSMSFIGYMVLMSPPNYDDKFKDRFEIKRDDTLKGSLIIQTVNPSDSAVYFCAASTQWCGLMQLLY